MRLLIRCFVLTLMLTGFARADVVVRSVTYDGRLSDSEARFGVALDLETTGADAVVPLFEGEVAVLAGKLPANLRLVREGNQYRLVATKAGRYQFQVEVVAKITRAEPWNRVSFTGPEAAIASVTAQAAGAGVEVQLLSGTVQESVTKEGVTRVRGFLGAERTVAVRWQSKAAEIARQSLLTCATTATVQVTPTVVKYATTLRYEIVQGSAARLVVTLPAAQALTKLQGEGVRDWAVRPAGDQQELTVEFIKPVEKAYTLQLFSEQPVPGGAATVAIEPPAPQAVEREAGSLTVAAEDVVVEIGTATGLRQVNAIGGALAAYQFYARPFTLAVRLRRIEPVVNVADRVTARLEEARLLVTHALTLNVEKAGVYALEITPQAGFVVADVRGDGVEDWKSVGGKLLVNFTTRVLGNRQVTVQLEQAVTAVGTLTIAPLRVTGAVKETAQIGAAAVAGLQLKTGAVAGAREVPVTALGARSDEVLAYVADQADWKLTLAAERLAARITADVFNLITIGDGLLGGSATLRYTILNQGVQEFRVQVPALWKNVEFTGANIRRKELVGDTWVIGLQEKAWGGYTLVVTYDFQFDPHKATLPLGGIHPVGVERETGSVAITSASNLELSAQLSGDNIRRVDEGELAANDRALLTRPALLAYQYQGPVYGLGVDVTRFEELPVLDAAADRTQLTTVLTDAGQMLTQASFMVKNNDRQFQTFTLPAGADFWSCYVGNEPVKPEKNGNKLLVPLPRRANRDESFAVDIVYAQKIESLKTITPRRLALAAPVTDMQTTYAEWELYVPQTHRLASFGGNMIVARGTTYGLRDAWQDWGGFYSALVRQPGLLLAACFVIALFAVTVVAFLQRRWIVGTGLLVFTLVVAGWTVVAAVRPVMVIASAGMADPSQLPPVSQYLGEKSRKGRELREEVRLRANFPSAELAGEPLPPASLVIVNGAPVQGGPEAMYGDGNVLFAAGQTTSPKVAGIRPIRIELPRTGTRFVFTKVLNVGQEPLAVRAVAMEQKVFNAVRGGAQAAAFVAGLVLVWWQWRRAEPKAWLLTVGVALALGAVVSLLVSWRILGEALILTVPVAGLALVVWVVRRVWKKKDEGGRMKDEGGGQPPIVPPVIAALAVLLAATSAGAVEKRCDSVPGADAAGRSFGQVVAGQRYFYEASGFIARNSDFSFWDDPDGNEFKDPHGRTPAGRGATNPAFRCPEATAFSLVARIGDDPCIQLGKKGSFVARATGNLTLFFNDDIFGDNSGSWNACVWSETEARPVVRGALPKSADAPVALPTPVSILSANYAGVVRAVDGAAGGRVVQFEAVLELESGEANQTVKLFGPDVAVQEFAPSAKRSGWFGSSGATGARLVREGGNVSVLLPQKGKTTVRVKFLVKLGGDVAKRQIVFGIPPALTSRVGVTIDEPEALVEAPLAVALKSTSGAQQTQVEVVLGAAERVELTWTPRMKRAAETAATVFCQNVARVAFGGGVVNVRALLDYQVTQGELRQLQVKIPAGHRLMRVEGEFIRTWKLDGQMVQVELVKGITPAYRLGVETEQVLDEKTAGLVAVEIPHAVEVKRETGLVALGAGEELSLFVASQEGLQKVDVEEFARAMPGQPASSAYRFLTPAFALAVRVEPVQPQVEAVVRNFLRIGTEGIGLQAVVDYSIKRAGVFALRLRLPAEYRVERVTGKNVAQWVESPGESRVLVVTLKERTVGAYGLTVDLARTVRELPAAVTVVGVAPVEVQKLSGFVCVTAEEGVQIKSETLTGVTEVPATTVAGAPAGGGTLAFKLIPGAADGTVAEWQVRVATERIESWVRAEVLNTIRLTETLVSGRSVVRYEIQNAPTKELRLRVPASFQNVELSGANIRRKDRDETTGEWRVELQNKVRGVYALTVTWEQPWNVKDGKREFTGVEAVGVERETGVIAVVAPPRLRLEPQAVAADLLKVDARDLPDWMERTSEPAVLMYRYLRPGYRLAVTTQRFEEAEVLQALADNVQITTVVAEDGQMMTEMKLAVRNNGRQYLEVTLPAGAEVWSAFVAGQPVRPSRRDGKLLLPLERSEGDAPVAVELTYVGAGPFPQRRGAVGLVSPALDVPLKNVRWEMYLPPDYTYSDFAGSMRRESAPVAAPPVAQTFSLWEYAREEGAKKEARHADVSSSLSNARSQLSSGFNGSVYRNLSRAKQQVDLDDSAANAELKQLEDGWRQSQALNFVQQGAGPAGSGGKFDQQAAQAQATKVQQAQELVVAKTLPLRLNLPKRGVQTTFTQVLQTELGKPMTVEFTAVNSRGISWLAWVGLGVGGFLALWGASAWAVSRRPM